MNTQTLEKILNMILYQTVDGMDIEDVTEKFKKVNYLTTNEKDDRLYNIIEALNEETYIWMNVVDELGNQCASTDRGIEKIIQIGRALEKIYSLEV